MGILDDAIREHLDLKRRQGAAEEDLARLEDEAFGPPTRPGDPEFPQTGESQAVGAQAPPAQAPAEEATGEEPLFQDHAAESELATPAGEPPTSEEPPAAPPTDEGPVLHDFQADVAPEPPGAPAPEPEAPPAPPAEPTQEHDSLASDEEVDLELDLDIEDEMEDIADLGDEELGDGEDSAPAAELAEPATPAADPGPVESMDTVEHHFEDAIDEAEVVEDDASAEPEAEPAEPAAPAAPAEPAAPPEEGEEGEDVLEETPEFLRDAPEDDELWFEQGEPKDFDF
jgi:hypothetical protein